MDNARPTLNDVAAAAGVSRSTVSLVIRERGNISEATRERVREAIARLGYVYNRGAASIRGRSTRSIGVIAPDSSNLFMGQLTAAFERQMDARGFVVLTCHSDEDADRQHALITALLERGVDAIVLLPAVGSEKRLAPLLHTIDIPVVIVVRPLADSAFTYVGADNRTGARMAAEHLLEHGCRTLGYVGGPEGLSLRADRLEGVREALAGSGAHLVDDLPSTPSGRGGREVVREMIDRGAVPDGLICHNDSVAFGAFRALRDAAPEQIGRVRVTGFDDVVEAELWEPPLTTLSINAQEVGRVAADLMMRSLDGESHISSVHIRPRLMIRESCGPHA